ncbi:MotA/TolQ/ExbB proton channel family protein [Echinimonas agarilytica]|uniref:MotA/TolQ/ExbB proton channel family protein n=1 Tax=Echinimonas agarilytica TaxID=1215918 RepID=A0AA42B8A2_9GAMM|nr:MotA/TolQ/ExbB proton channel family protein [Echinimonas agarilytica]
MKKISFNYAGLSRASLLGLSLFISPNLQADPLKDLYLQVSQEVSEEANHNSEREKKFKAAAGEQKAMLAEVQTELARQEQLREEMQQTFDLNETQLADLSTQLDRRTGNLGELFGVFRQMAGDTEKLLFDSLISIEYPERKAQIEALAATTEVPTIAQMQQLWAMSLQEISESAGVTRFNTEVVKPSGEAYTAEVTRIGTFNIISEDKYLNYSSDTQQLVELARQPDSSLRSTAGDLSQTSGGTPVGFALDPSRGALLGLLVQSPSLVERVQQGKSVGYAIIAVGIFGLLVVIERLIKLASISKKMAKQRKDMEHPSDDNPLGRMLLAYYENKHLQDLDVIGKKLEEVVFKDLAEFRRGLATVKVLAAIAPLMGLLGTVTGMIGTFQAITLFGTGDPKLMAGGISQALITTVEGLCVAIPLLLASTILSSRAQQMSKEVGEQATGMVAQKAVDIASAKA